MIALSASQAAMLYLSFTIGVLFCLWLSYHFKSKKRVILPDREELCICEFCHCLYVTSPLKTVHQCPECKSFNKNNRFPPMKR